MLVPSNAATTLEIVGVCLFALAVTHTFAASYVAKLGQASKAHSGLWHLLGEVETVFGIWAVLLVLFMIAMAGLGPTAEYLDSRQFIEPMFVFVIMIMASSRPVLQLVMDSTQRIGGAMPVPAGPALYFLGLALIPLLGSVITEPAAMALAALMLREVLFTQNVSKTLRYATVGALFVNVSIGGALTHFAAPPILMVAAKWEWNTALVFGTIGWKAGLAVLINALALTLIFRRQLLAHARGSLRREAQRVPAPLVAASVLLVAGVVYFNHDPEIFIGLFLLFLGLFEAYKAHFGKLMFRGALMVALFLAGLVVLGGLQKWWLQPLLSGMSEGILFYGAVALTAITDNAALTYLGSLVDGVSDEFKYALVTGAIAGGGLTVIANAPNPAGYAILKDTFEDRVINPFWLLLGALPPTFVALVCFRGLAGDLGGLFNLAYWEKWIEGADRGFLFLVILPFVVAAVAIWNDRREAARAAGSVSAAEGASRPTTVSMMEAGRTHA